MLMLSRCTSFTLFTILVSRVSMVTWRLDVNGNTAEADGKKLFRGVNLNWPHDSIR